MAAPMIGPFYCHSLLEPLSKRGFCHKALTQLADGHPMPWQLNYSLDELYARYDAANCACVALPGLQPKLGLSLHDGTLRFAEEKSKYILKWQPRAAGAFATDVAANEHLTMQLAAQVFKIVTAPNACITLLDDHFAYLTRRFDYQGRQRIHIEDLCQLGERNPYTHGPDYKVKSSYEEAAELLKRYCSGYRLEALRFFKRVLFNIVVGNGHAHLKNISAMRLFSGLYMLAPAYDLMNTALHHPDQPPLAMPLFKDGYTTPTFQQRGHYSRADIVEFGHRIGLENYQITEELRRLDLSKDKIERLVKRSFLTPKAQKRYLQILTLRKRQLLR